MAKQSTAEKNTLTATKPQPDEVREQLTVLAARLREIADRESHRQKTEKETIRNDLLDIGIEIKRIFDACTPHLSQEDQDLLADFHEQLLQTQGHLLRNLK